MVGSLLFLTPLPELKVGFILSPNFTLLPFAGVIDALRHAADVSDFRRRRRNRVPLAGAIKKRQSDEGEKLTHDQ